MGLSQQPCVPIASVDDGWVICEGYGTSLGNEKASGLFLLSPQNEVFRDRARDHTFGSCIPLGLVYLWLVYLWLCIPLGDIPGTV